MGVMCLIFLGLFQLSQLFAAKEILQYSASRGARARTVGFNNFMVWKTARLGSIANAGLMTSPGFVHDSSSWGIATPAQLWNSWFRAMRETPASEQFAVENSRMPLYLGAQWAGELDPILDYKDWDTLNIDSPVENDFASMLTMKVSQKFPLRLPLHGAFYADDSVDLEAKATLENNYPLYLIDLEL